MVVKLGHSLPKKASTGAAVVSQPKVVGSLCQGIDVEVGGFCFLKKWNECQGQCQGSVPLSSRLTLGSEVQISSNLEHTMKQRFNWVKARSKPKTHSGHSWWLWWTTVVSQGKVPGTVGFLVSLVSIHVLAQTSICKVLVANANAVKCKQTHPQAQASTSTQTCKHGAKQTQHKVFREEKTAAGTAVQHLEFWGSMCLGTALDTGIQRDRVLRQLDNQFPSQLRALVMQSIARFAGSLWQNNIKDIQRHSKSWKAQIELLYHCIHLQHKWC